MCVYIHIVLPASVLNPSLCFLQEDSGAGGGLGASSANVNRYIQQLAQEYSGDCKTSFDELSKIIQVKISLSSRKASILLQVLEILEGLFLRMDTQIDIGVKVLEFVL